VGYWIHVVCSVETVSLVVVVVVVVVAVFNQGDEGRSWYIIIKGSVNVVIHAKVLCTSY